MHPNIQMIHSKFFPKHYLNDVNGWAFSKKEIEDNSGKLLTLDIDFGSKCTLHCPHCFKKGGQNDNEYNGIDYEKLKNLIIEAKTLGLKSIKIVGKGEPFETPAILTFLEFLNNNDIIPLVFTKGHILGNEEKVKKLYEPYDIKSCDDLIARLYSLNVSILLGFNSFSSSTQDKMVGNVKGYSLIRNRALELLVNAGFNKNNPTRIGLILAPLTNDNYEEAFDIYVWARRRNLYPVITPTMVSGHLRDNDEWKKITPPEDKLIELYSKIYQFNIDNYIQSYEQIKQEGISAYAGVHPCNQVSVGMYLTYTGKIISCPGDDKKLLGNIQSQSLTEIWHNYNRNRSQKFNNGCPAKCGKSIPDNFFDTVFLHLTNNLLKANHDC